MLDTIKMKFFLKKREIEEQREETMGSLEFQNWMRELNISQSYEDPTLKLNAGDLMRQYDMKKYSNLNFKNN
jgi:hypothetical protein